MILVKEAATAAAVRCCGGGQVVAAGVRLLLWPVWWRAQLLRHGHGGSGGGSQVGSGRRMFRCECLLWCGVCCMCYDGCECRTLTVGLILIAVWAWY